MWLFLALVLVPIIEIALFIEVGGWIGLWPTIGIVILTALLGTMLLRQQGLAALADLQGRLSEGRDPRNALAHGALILVSGIVLLTPGFFTDALGFLLLIPPVRSALIRNIQMRMQVHATMHAEMRTETRSGPRRPPDADQSTIDGEYTDVTPPEEQETPGNSGWTRPTDQGNRPR
ncbi:MAG: FxsA family protein [Pseudomonadota bacterium]